MSVYKLAADYDGAGETVAEEKKEKKKTGYIPNLKLDKIIPNRYQPRSNWKVEKLMELADSIRENGIVEPLIVTEKGKGKYEIIAGERRFRASKIAGLTTVPVVIKEATPRQMLELAVVENVQRADLNALEEATAFYQLAREFSLTHEQIATKLGCSRSAVANKIRLLALPEEVKQGLNEEKISEGHARSILGLADKRTMIMVFEKVVRENLSVRATEELVRKLSIGGKGKKGRTRKLDLKNQSKYTKQLTTKLKNQTVKLKPTKNKIVLEVTFKDEEELSRFIKDLK